jgi:1-acyl-sn-glycerol-3-phosphate acyltransferase
MLIMVWQHNPSFLGKRAILSIPFIGTVGFVNEMIAVDRENIVATGKGAATNGSNSSGNGKNSNNPGSVSTKDKIVAHILDPNAPPLLVFPEGTTCRNDCLLQFKAGGAFQTAHGAMPVQPMLLTFNKKKWLPWCDTFDYANTPATNNKLWALRFFCRFRHSLTVTYLPPVDPHHLPDAVAMDRATAAAADGAASSEPNASTMTPMAFANATRDALSEAMGPSAHVTEQSYEEFFLFKEGCEKLKLPGQALRSLDFKRARDAVGTQTGNQPQSESSKPLTLEGAKASLRAYGACRRSQQDYQQLAEAAPFVEGVTTTGLLRTLLAPPSSHGATPATDSGRNTGANGTQNLAALDEASELWLSVAAEAALVDSGGRVVLHEQQGTNASGVSSQPLYDSSFSADNLNAAPHAALDFQAFLVGLHRKRPRAAVAAGWLDNFGNNSAKGNASDSASGAQVFVNAVSNGSSDGDNSAMLESPEGRKRPRTRAAAAAEK